jgi:hypothetical protein
MVFIFAKQKGQQFRVQNTTVFKHCMQQQSTGGQVPCLRCTTYGAAAQVCTLNTPHWTTQNNCGGDGRHLYDCQDMRCCVVRTTTRDLDDRNVRMTAWVLAQCVWQDRGHTVELSVRQDDSLDACSPCMTRQKRTHSGVVVEQDDNLSACSHSGVVCMYGRMTTWVHTQCSPVWHERRHKVLVQLSVHQDDNLTACSQCMSRQKSVRHENTLTESGVCKPSAGSRIRIRIDSHWIKPLALDTLVDIALLKQHHQEKFKIAKNDTESVVFWA